MKKILLPTAVFLTVCRAVSGQALTVTNLVPGRGAVGVLRSAPVSITFSQAIDPATANAVQVNSVRGGGKKVGTYSTNGNTVTFAPTTAFLPGETVQVTVPATVRSTTGGSTAPQCYEFTTAVGSFGGGAFAAPITASTLVSVDYGPRSVVLGDIDGDGDLDMLVGTGTGAVSVRLNDGLNSGSFVAPATNASFAVGTASGPVQLALGDVDGDGDLDVLATAGNVPLALRLNSGLHSGVFVAPANGSSIAVGSFAKDPVLGDVDGDGDLDVLTANVGGNSVSIRRNNGLNSGLFVTPASGAEVTVGAAPSQVLLGDVDNDGDLDILARCGNNIMSLRLNSGLNSGTFAAPTTNADFSTGDFTASATLGDVNSDGYPDLVVSKAGIANSIETWLNSGNSHTFTLFQSIAVSRQPMQVVLGDLDGDGDPDLLIGNDNNTNTVTLRLNGGLGSGLFVEPVFTPTPAVGASFPGSVALGDVDGDGNLDVLTANNNNSGSGTGGGRGTVSVLLNQISNLRTALAPTTGTVGAVVMLRGTNLTGTSAVSFNGTPVPAADFSVVSPVMLRVLVPSGATTGPVTVTTPQGVLISNTRFVLSGALAAMHLRPNASLLVYPNPTHGPLTVVVPPIAGATTVQLALLNVLGQTVRQQQAALPVGAAHIHIDTSLVPAGTYLLRMQAGSHTEIRRVVVN
ncbi:FG-GAP-like repeat-containing protein [Hymenobacter frigidus]|uniref:FG-GAP-like repeat-containing protein n=1 Tax=Hymenobacter frigidus TaxID=1524095 RepID=UPI001663B4F0|nr:FG-GAP-like repeat-containing protein [Hymenobacter frigidus]